MASAVITRCDDFTGLVPWYPFPDTVHLYSLSRREWVGRPGAFDFVYRRPVVVEGIDELEGWDITVAEGEGGLRFLLPASFPGLGWISGIRYVDARGHTLESALDHGVWNMSDGSARRSPKPPAWRVRNPSTGKTRVRKRPSVITHWGATSSENMHGRGRTRTYDLTDVNRAL
jgi:hypothetical protein